MCLDLALSMELAVGMKVLETGSKSSASMGPLALVPPARSTRPFCNTVAVWPLRDAAIETGKGENALVAGSKISALLREPALFRPPARRYVPFGNGVEVWPALGEIMAPASGVKLPSVGL